MADEAEEAKAPEASEGEASGEKEKKRGFLFVAIVVLVLLAATGGAAYWFGVIPGLGPSAQESLEEGGEPADPHAKKLSLGPTMALDPFIVNLADPDGKRYLKANIEVEFYGERVPEGMHEVMPQLRDSLLTLLTSKSFEDIRTPEGKQALREEIIARLNQSLKTDSVKGVYFTEFIIQ